MNRYTVILFFLVISMPSFAYVGPGMGGGVIAAVFGFLVAILLTLWGILYYPIKRSLKKRRKMKDEKIKRVDK